MAAKTSTICVERIIDTPEVCDSCGRRMRDVTTITNLRRGLCHLCAECAFELYQKLGELLGEFIYKPL